MLGATPEDQLGLPHRQGAWRRGAASLLWTSLSKGCSQTQALGNVTGDGIGGTQAPRREGSIWASGIWLWPG